MTDAQAPHDISVAPVMKLINAVPGQVFGAIDMEPGRQGIVVGAFHMPHFGPSFAIGLKYLDGAGAIAATTVEHARELRDELTRLIEKIDSGAYDQPERAQ